MQRAIYPHQLPALLAQNKRGSSSSSSSSTGWRLLAVAGVLSIWVITKLLENETKPKVRMDEEEEEEAAAKAKARATTTSKNKQEGWWLSGRWSGGFWSEEQEDDEEDDAEDEDEEKRRAKHMEVVQEKAWAEVEHDFSVAPNPEKARQLVELARMKGERRRREVREEARREEEEARLGGAP